MDASEQILRQLRHIKFFTVSIVLSFVMIVGAIAYMTYALSSLVEQSEDSNSFTDQASRLIEEGKEAEALVLCQEREKKRPKDPNVHWYKGKAHYQLGQYAEALKAIQYTHELAPTWREEHTAPYLKAIEEKLGQATKP